MFDSTTISFRNGKHELFADAISQVYNHTKAPLPSHPFINSRAFLFASLKLILFGKTKQVKNANPYNS